MYPTRYFCSFRNKMTEKRKDSAKAALFGADRDFVEQARLVLTRHFN